MSSEIRHCAPLGVIFAPFVTVAFLVGCSSSSIPQAQRSSRDRTPDVMRSERAEWYRTAQSRQVDRVCELTPRDSVKPIPFKCGVVRLMLKPGTPIEAIKGFLANVAASDTRRFPGPSNLWYVNVPIGTELKVVQSAYSDANVVRADLSLEVTGSI